MGPLFDVAGYAFAAAAVLAPFSGFNIVTGIEKSKGGEEFFSEKNGELTTVTTWEIEKTDCLLTRMTRMTRTIRVHVTDSLVTLVIW